jgi:hypothetical protein
VVSVLGLLACFIYLIAIFYLKRDSKLDFKSWDVQTITPGDYSVEYQISAEGYKWFQENVYVNENDHEVSPGFALKNYMKREIERILNEQLAAKKTDRSFDHEHNSLETVKIADIVFAFNNSELVGLLRKRGAAIMN